ncbi:DUF2889 domain-containing protein [Novosphingobium mangrovi (ex Huang et al. 2023)]|uniref:DUF2889 domain-containing protein n=1 Tax=Novosphingobium mangrovi (ex Huang et al. 2023) TaxID=2976432 RepID=A0ABT2I2V6_9SPHN|nr:DUF2889 domain-containing protein [Novosphingobium mangrovi (ex Huang et al. 2023)]MCT2399134.1 DUF2889 domain-containing protein [Novosphingobium mangrovi (ex Huang et al. 2023)]
MEIETLPPPPRSTANPAPKRPANSVRRTTSIDVSWPDGIEGQRLFVGAARDVVTPADGGAPRLVAEGSYRARLKEDKTITEISADLEPEGLSKLVGARAGGHLRMLLGEVMPDLIAQTHPLYLVLDDLSGSALVSAFAWSQWYPDWAEKLRQRIGEEEHAKLMTQRVNVCWGLQEGHSGLQPGGPPSNVADADAGDVRNPEDPHGWHALPEHEGPGFRRARRIDVVRDEAAGVIRIDSAFQDSASKPDGGRIAIHEYLLRATADIDTLEVLSIEPEARILPFSECPGAIANTQRLVGRKLPDIRAEVLAQLRGPEGCTHLNDALRALADVPELVAELAA